MTEETNQQIIEESNQEIAEYIKSEYEAGFITDIEADTLPPGLNEDVVRFISGKKASLSGC